MLVRKQVLWGVVGCLMVGIVCVIVYVQSSVMLFGVVDVVMLYMNKICNFVMGFNDGG